MKRHSLLLMADPASGGGTATPAPTGELPKAAETAANGKSEREILLERQNKKLVDTVKKTADGKRKAEEAAAIAQREAEKLKQVQLDAIKPAQPAKTKWGFFES
jgi:hypothetical protein